MYQSRNFTQVEAGWYSNAQHRAVLITGFEMVPHPNYPEDRSKDLRKWQGTMYKMDGKTPADTQHFTDDGSLWGIKATSNPYDLARRDAEKQSAA